MNELFEHAVQTGDIAGAYLVTGPSGGAVSAEADAFLMRLFCAEKSACGTCPGCKKYRSENHADIMVIRPKGKTIKIDDVREIPAMAAIKSYEGGRKAVLIKNADTMTVQSQNALLKVLEEPPPGFTIVLEAPDTKNLLPTVLSRCIIVKTSDATENPEARLISEYGLPTLRARALLNAAQGEYPQAAQYMEDGWFDIREDMLLLAGRMLRAKTKATSAMEKLLTAHEAQVDLALKCLMIVLADVLRAKHGAPVINEDRQQELGGLAQASDYMILNAVEKINELIVKRDMCAGLNMKMATGAALLSLVEDII